MDNTHDTTIYVVVGLIICVQLFFFLKNFKKIMAYKNIIVSNKKLSIVELSIDEETATTMDPEYFLENKRFFEISESLESEDFIEEIDDSESYEENEYDADENDGHT